MGNCWLIFGIMGNRWPIFRFMGNWWPIFRIIGNCWPLSMVSIRDMYEKIAPNEQIDPLMTFVEYHLQKMNNPSKAGSSSSEGWLATVQDGTKLGAKTINTISTEVEKLSNLDPVKALGSVTLNVMEKVGDMYWVFMGLSVAAYSVEKYSTSVRSMEEECKKLLVNILEHSKDVKQYSNRMSDDKEMLCKAVGTIVEDAVVFCDYLKMGKNSRDILNLKMQPLMHLQQMKRSSS